MFEKVFILNVPSFYKVNLLNRISDQINIYVIFLSINNNDRSMNFVSEEMRFKNIILSQKKFENRNKVFIFFKLYKTISTLRYKQLIVGGWDILEIFFLLLLKKNNNTSMILESTIYDSKVKGVYRLYKKTFLLFINKVFASGALHKKLLIALGYKGKIIITKGVGIINKPETQFREKNYNKKFLFVGRLIKEKNLEFLISIFNKLPNFSLTIVGDGFLKEILSSKSNNNIIFIGHVDNDKLGALLNNADFLILPSIKETWGLVIEESLYYNTPVIISSKCGAVELVDNRFNGIVIDPYNLESTIKIIEGITKIKYKNFVNNIDTNSLKEKDIKQVNYYIEN